MSDYIDFIESFQRNKHTDIQEYMKHSIKEDNVELEVVYGDLSDKSKLNFNNIINKDVLNI